MESVPVASQAHEGVNTASSCTMRYAMLAPDWHTRLGTAPLADQAAGTLALHLAFHEAFPLEDFATVIAVKSVVAIQISHAPLCNAASSR
jgi:hypothetical protein